MQAERMAELNLLWATLILDELARLGVKDICIAPGSRSSPLTLAVSQSKLKKHVHFDERGLGFIALGLAKASHRSVAVITTSGTAVANLYPAIIEAWLTKVPLIILSGDRPPELLQCGANQAILQEGIFAGYAKSLNLPTPDLSLPPQALLSRIDELISNQTQPVHINCMYREPLYPAEINHDPKFLYVNFDSYLAEIKNWLYSDNAYCKFSKTKLLGLPCFNDINRFSQGKGVIVAGILLPQENANDLIEFARLLDWPLLTDAQSQLRQNSNTVGHTDQLLQSPKSLELLEKAEKVIVFGGRILSKRLINYLAKQKWQEYWQVIPVQELLDPSHSHKQVWISDISSFVSLPWKVSNNANWAEALNHHNHQLERLFIENIDQGEFGEAQIVRCVASCEQTKQLVIGNSLPIRLFDMFAPICKRQESPAIYTNRGASGIDGVLATACGVVLATNEVTTFIIGDLSQLHDLNSFAIARDIHSPFVIIILNNDGGNIFNLLPVPNESLRADYYRLSHGINFEHGAKMFELPYVQVINLNDFHLAYEQAINHQGASVIEVTVSSHQASDQISAISKMVRAI